MSRYHQVYDGDWFRPSRRGFREQCCDCGKVHDVDFRIVKSAGGRKRYIEFRARQNAKATRAARARAHAHE